MKTCLRTPKLRMERTTPPPPPLLPPLPLPPLPPPLEKRELDASSSSRAAAVLRAAVGSLGLCAASLSEQRRLAAPAAAALARHFRACVWGFWEGLEQTSQRLKRLLCVVWGAQERAKSHQQGLAERRAPTPAGARTRIPSAPRKWTRRRPSKIAVASSVSRVAHLEPRAAAWARKSAQHAVVGQPVLLLSLSPRSRRACHTTWRL